MKTYIASILQTFSKFPDVQHIQVIPSPSSTVAAAAVLGNIALIKVTSPAKPEVPAKMCLGNLKYLSKILSTKQVSEHAELKATIGESIEKEEIVQSIDFIAPRMKIRYQATDPKAAGKIPTLKSQDWVATIALQPSHYSEFSDAVKLQQVMAPQKNEFKIGQKDEYLTITLETGERSSEADIGLTFGAVEGSLPKSYYLNTSMFLAGLSLAQSADSAKVMFSASVCRIAITSGDDEIEIVIPKQADGRR